MAGLIPWRKRRREVGGNGGELATPGDFPALVRRMQGEFDDLVNRFTQFWPISAKGFGNGWRWGLDVEEKDDSVIVRAEAPGFEAGDFDIQVSENRLVLRASRKTETKKNEGEYREEHECYEEIELPTEVDKDKIDARYHNGVLTLTMPKSVVNKAKKVTVKAN